MAKPGLRKTILVVHGDKGGVGKSTLAALCVDYCIDQFGACAVVEGDSKIDDVARRFGGTAGVSGYLVDLARADASEDAAVRLFEELERANAAHVIVNTPASASSTIDAQADLIVPAAHELGYTVTVAWLVGAGEESARLAGESALCAQADRKVAVINDHYGTAATSIWERHAARAAWLESGGLETHLPDLTERVAEIVRASTGRISALSAPDSNLPVVTRTVIKRWVQAAWTGPCAAIYQDTDHD